MRELVSHSGVPHVSPLLRDVGTPQGSELMPSVSGASRFLIMFLAVAVSPSPTLRQAADQAGVLVGAAVRPSLFSEAAYSETLAREYNMVEPEDVMKWWVVRRDPKFDFREGDEVVRFAKAHGMKVRGHCLVWDHNNPAWLTEGGFTPDQLSHLLEEHITTVMKHYAGQVFAWDVVNEALDENGHPKDSVWYNQPGIGLAGKGTAYVEQAFRWAREADPQALLFYNEAEGEGLNRKSDAVYAMVKDFRQRGVPIDGVGLQLHISRLDLDTAAIAANIARLAALRSGSSHRARRIAPVGPDDQPGRQGRSAAAGGRLPRSGPGLPAESGLHRDSNLGIHRQVLMDRLALPRYARRSTAFRPRLQTQAGLRCHARGVGCGEDVIPNRATNPVRNPLFCRTEATAGSSPSLRLGSE